eukprot:326160-Chlamydomonas_euryale.AAC.2
MQQWPQAAVHSWGEVMRFLTARSSKPGLVYSVSSPEGEDEIVGKGGQKSIDPRMVCMGRHIASNVGWVAGSFHGAVKASAEALHRDYWSMCKVGKTDWAGAAKVWLLYLRKVWTNSRYGPGAGIRPDDRPRPPPSPHPGRTLMNGALTSFASLRATSVLPHPVGPIMRMFLGMTSSRTAPASCMRRHRLRSATATARFASYWP